VFAKGLKNSKPTEGKEESTQHRQKKQEIKTYRIFQHPEKLNLGGAKKTFFYLRI